MEVAVEQQETTSGGQLIRIAEVVPDIPVTGLEEAYSYEIPEAMQLARGDAVLVPFGGRTVVGYVVDVTRAERDAFDFRLRSIASKIAGLALPESLMQLLEFIADEFMATPGACVMAAMPPGVRTRLSTAYQLTGGDESQVTGVQRDAIRFIKDKGGRISEASIRTKKPFAKTVVAGLVRRGLLERSVELPLERRAARKSLVLGDEVAADRFLEREAKRKPAQAACLLALREAPRVGLSPAEIAALGGVTDSVVARLVESGLLVDAPPAEATAENPKTLTEEQARAVAAITEALKGRSATKFLLHGVTGSGKTEVYLRCIAETLALGKRALYLVPEIALTAQVVGQIRERFGSNVAVMHSGLAEGERLRHWRRIRSGDAPVVIGARSAIFAPIENLGLIVVDEEHEGSYKQDSTPRYHLRSLAEFRAKESRAALILGSATPSVETYYRAQQGELQLLKLTRRAATSELPAVSVTDLREVYRAGRPAILADDLHKRIEETLAAKEQAILFINRRAYAHSLLCRECGHVPKCKNCSVTMTLHRKVRKLKCHHCGAEQPAPSVCPNCGSYRLRPLGLGTEKVEEAVREAFPAARVARLDRDAARRVGAVEETFANLRAGELDILVGTQMIAKGLDFPNVTLVGVVAADTGLNIPDYRATERTYQLLTQVSGRAGRQKPGRVVIQSFQPESAAVHFAAERDYMDFYAAEILERKEAGYPPFCRLINVVASGPNLGDVLEAIKLVHSAISDQSSARIIGPADCPIARLHGKWRKHLLLKLAPGARLERITLPDVDRTVQITFDVDPGTLL
jgi:primosomal protein N' (replication factor Y)